MKVMFILGGGGHTQEMLRLIDNMNIVPYEVMYLIPKEDVTSEKKIIKIGKALLHALPSTTAEIMYCSANLATKRMKKELGRT